MTGVSSKAMLVYLTISGWGARKHDDKTSDEIAEQHGTTAKRAGNYNKCLIDTEAPAWKAVKQAEDRIRKFHYANTLKWSINGAQMLTAAMFFDYGAKLQKLKGEWEEAVADFLSIYPRLKENARREMNGLYDESAYPSVEQLEEKFTFDVAYQALPSGADMERLRGAIGVNAEIEAMARSVEARVESAVGSAMQDLAGRVLEPVRHMADKLAGMGKNSRLRDTLVENVREMVALLPKMNLTGNQELAQIGEEIKRKLTTSSTQELREDDVRRAQVAKDAQEIARKMAAFMGRKS
jgi:hypothetical protein